MDSSGLECLFFLRDRTCNLNESVPGTFICQFCVPCNSEIEFCGVDSKRDVLECGLFFVVIVL